MVKVTDHTRTSIWDDFTDAERYLRYYISLADKHRKRHYWVRMALLALVLVEGGIMAPLAASSIIPYGWGIATVAVSGAIVIGLTVFDALSDDAKTSAKLTFASEDIQVIHTEWRLLWLDVETDQVSEEDARARHRELLYRTNAVAIRVEVNMDEGRNDKYSDEAVEVMRKRFVQTT